ncbi:AMP-binding protein [Celeribacter sp. PS-C1]|uniref:AMP-binding protein n=1 Tax=Celeribacter sp. PS-C1 TaxID=2820813 RepID=UPI001CA4A2B7|nr:AMP-binding protein [Celeribacter sp. PS-C1]MBW6417034.1 AMP-binding protein [Celeribacter sp. PS-C1]
MRAEDIRAGALCPVTLEAALARTAALVPEVEAIVAPDGRRTFAELSEEVARLRGALHAAGVRRGMHVGVCLGNGALFQALFIAIGSIGAVMVPLNTRLRSEDIAYCLRQSRVRLLITADRVLSSDFISLLGPLIGRELPDLERVVLTSGDAPWAESWNAFLEQDVTGEPDRSKADDVVLMQYTSGSTGFPKGVMLRQHALLTNGFISAQRMGLRVADRFHSARPFFHVAGTSLSLCAALQMGVTLVTMERFEPAEALRLMEEERCTHFSGNDTMALMLLNHADRPSRRLCLRGGWVAGSATVLRRVVHELGATECVSGYGLSEASPNIAQSAWWEDEAVRTGGLMRPQTGLEVGIFDPETGVHLSPGEKGEIRVRGWSVMSGYFDMPEKTNETLSPEGWLLTGDLGRVDAKGRLEFLGRLKNIVRVGGENVSPEEVEDILHRHPAIKQAQVVGVPDPRLQEVCAAFVILNDGVSLDLSDLAAWAKDAMAGFKIPRHVWIVDNFEEIGMTASAKVQKSKLAEHARKLLEEV